MPSGLSVWRQSQQQPRANEGGRRERGGRGGCRDYRVDPYELSRKVISLLAVKQLTARFRER